MRIHKRNVDGLIVCTVYRRYVDWPGSKYHGKSYIGVTDDIVARDKQFAKMNDKYAGKDLTEAQRNVPLQYWKRDILEVFMVATDDEYKVKSEARETFYIAKYDSYNNGLNGNLGGAGNKGVKFSEERCRQNGDNRRGKPHSEKTKEILRLKSTGRVKSAEERKKIADGNTGKKRTPEMRKAQSERMKGKVPTAANEARKGKPSKLKGQAQKPAAIAVRVQSRKESGQRIKVTAPNGTITCYICQTDAAKATGLKDGSVYYALNRPDGMHTKSGYKFERISDAEYQAWKSANS